METQIFGSGADFGRDTILKKLSEGADNWEFLLKDDTSSIRYRASSKGSYIKFDGIKEVIEATMVIESGDVAAGTQLTEKDSNGEAVPFVVIDEVPIFPGCENAADPRACFQANMQKHISKNFRYPEEAQEKGIQGRVSVLFVIQEDGSIGAVRMRGPDKTLEDEAARIIDRLPKMMSPGKQDGKAVRVPFSIPITFKLQGNLSSREMKVSSSSYDVASTQLYVKITEGSRALPGANVSVIGKHIQKVINFDGAVTVAAEKGDIVEFQYGGYPNLKFKVAD